MKKRKDLIKLVILLIASLMVLSGCSSKVVGTEGKDKVIIFADAGWDSIKLHNEIASFIIENGYGYETDMLYGSSTLTFAGLRRGYIDVYMETWTDNLIDVYQNAISSGEIIEVSTNYDDNSQGLYVPTVIIKGDPEKGIAPMAPDLKYIKDLKKYWELFKDPEVPTKGRVYGSPPGWSADQILQEKIKSYGLDKTFNYFSPGSETSLSTSLAAAAEKDEPWVGYYWEPTWVLGKYDMTLLEDESAFPSTPVTVCVYKDLEKSAPEVVSFLSKYKTSSEVTSKALAYMQDTGADTKEAAIWFLKEYEELWTTWVPKEIVDKVNIALYN